MAWATPNASRAVGYIVTAANWNELGNDLRYLKGMDGIVAIENAFTLTQVATPSAPGAGLTSLYSKSDGSIYRRSGAAGTEEEVGSAAFGSRMLLMGG